MPVNEYINIIVYHDHAHSKLLMKLLYSQRKHWANDSMLLQGNNID